MASKEPNKEPNSMSRLESKDSSFSWSTRKERDKLEMLKNKRSNKSEKKCISKLHLSKNTNRLFLMLRPRSSHSQRGLLSRQRREPNSNK